MILSLRYTRLSKKIFAITLFSLLTSSTILAQNNNKVTFGEKGSKEIVGSSSISTSFYDVGTYNDTQFFVSYNYFPAKQFHIGTSLQFSAWSFSEQKTSGSIGTSFTTGYLFILSKNLYFDIASRFNVSYYINSFAQGMVFIPVIQTTLKQRYKNIIINYGISQSFISYNSNPIFGKQWGEPYYNLGFSIGISIPF